MMEKRRQDRAVALAFERVGRGCFQQCPGLAVAQGWGLAFVRVDFRALDAADRVVAHRIDLAEVIKRRSHGGELHL